MRRLCKASSTAMTFDLSSGDFRNSDAGRTPVYGLHVHINVLNLSLTLYPSRTSLPLTKSFCHESAYRLHDSVSACLERNAPAPGVAQFGSFSLCQGPSNNECCTNGASGHRTVTGGACQVHHESGYPLPRRHTAWPENMGAPPGAFRACG
jgi:hypothetical protein